MRAIILTAAPLIEPHPLMLSPFVAMLLCIALLPFILKRHWEQHYHMVAIVLAIIPIAYYVLFLRRPQRLFQEGRDYISFIALLGSLFVVTGGIHIGVRGKTNPLKNSVFLLCGGLLANVIGNTGASVLLIRPWIRLNRGRYRGLHTAFFIFIMGNVGGGVTPLGPPLLLGYLKGVAFWWVALQCWKPRLITIISLVAIFYALDSMSFRRAPVQICQEDTDTAEFVRFKGQRNLWFLAIILTAVFVRHPPFVREILMLTAAAASYRLTPKSIHQANRFSFHPIQEVAWLFLGIFATMVPVLDYLQFHADHFALNTPAQYFCITGGLSACWIMRLLI